MLGNCLRVTAIFLVAVLSAFILFEAFDGDVDLWPIGAEDCTLAGDALTLAVVRPLQELVSSKPIPCFGLTAGAHLVTRHRARSAIATVDPPISPSLNVAEPRRQDLNDAPVLGHFVYTGPGDDRNGTGRERRAQPSPPFGALPLARSLAS